MKDKIINTVLISLPFLVLLNGDFNGFLVSSVFLFIYLFIQKTYETDRLDKWVYIFVYLLNIFAFLFDFYRLEWFDDIAHTITPLALVVYAGPYIYRNVLNKATVPTFVKFFALVTLGVTLGALWEVWEFYANVGIFERSAPTMHDTISDLIFDTIGTVIGAFIILIHE